MENPIDLIESIPSAIKTVAQSVDIAKWIADQYQKRRASRPGNEPQEDDSMDDCFLKTLYLLRQESENKKLEYIKCFAQNTLLSDTSDINPEGTLSFLMDIEQMTWRQICLLEGFRRQHDNEIKIIGMRASDTSGMLNFRELKKLGFLEYLSGVPDRTTFGALKMAQINRIRVTPTATELASLMNLQSIPDDEIVRAFGKGMITETKSKTY